MGLPENRPPITPPDAKPQRLESLDAYRGFIMLAMVSAGMGMGKLLGDPNWGWLADQFEHRTWEGCTFWDLIQPSFMFMVGVSMPFAFAVRQQQGQSWGRQFLHVVKRCLLLIAIGIFLDSFNKDVVTVQLIRVLQQIAIGYFLAFFVLHRGPVVQLLTAALVLIVHTAAFQLYGGSGDGGPWVRDQNLGTYLDQALRAPFAELTWINLFPPSTGGYVTINALSSTATILFGVACGELLRSDWPASRKMLVMLVAGLAGLALGLALSPWVPMVKRIWTSSFALFAAGWTSLLMLAFYTIIDVLRIRRWAFPFVVVGMNSIFIYVSAGVLSGPIRSAWKPVVGSSLDQLGPWGPVVMAVLVLATQWLLCYALYRRKIFLKV